jgi:hypothetical protein
MDFEPFNFVYAAGDRNCNAFLVPETLPYAVSVSVGSFPEEPLICNSF